MFGLRKAPRVTFPPLSPDNFDGALGPRKEPEVTGPAEGFATCADAADANPFKEGDVVQLKSGGTLMTVLCGGCVDVEVVWFDGDGNLQEECFSQAVLRHHDETFPF